MNQFDLESKGEGLVEKEAALIRSYRSEVEAFQTAYAALIKEEEALEREYTRAAAAKRDQFAGRKADLDVDHAGQRKSSEQSSEADIQAARSIVADVAQLHEEATRILRSAGRTPSYLAPLTTEPDAGQAQESAELAGLSGRQGKALEAVAHSHPDPLAGLRACVGAAQTALKEIQDYLQSAWLQNLAIALMLAGGVTAVGFGFATHPALGLTFGGVATVIFIIFVNRIRQTDSYAHMRAVVDRANSFFQLVESRAQVAHQRRLEQLSVPHAAQLRELEQLEQQDLEKLELETERKREGLISRQVEAEQRQKMQIGELQDAARRLSDQIDVVTPPWANSEWTENTNKQIASKPDVLRFGSFSVGEAPDHLELPAVIRYPLRRPLIVTVDGQERGRAVYRALQSLVLRILAAAPDGRIRFTFVDPVGRGENVAAFMALKDLDPDLVSAKAWTERQDIEQQLRAITDHMEYVIQMRLRNEHDDIEAYNARAGALAEAYRVLVVFDFPANFSEESSQRLVSIAANGVRCGVHTLVVVDNSEKVPYGFRVEDLLESGDVLTLKNGILKWLGYSGVDADEEAEERDAFNECALTLDAPPVPALFNTIVKRAGVRALESGEIKVSFDSMASSLGEVWSWNSRTEIRAPLGPADARNLQEMEFGGDDPNHVHALVVGRTGSGKTNLLHVLILGLSLRYSPEELELYLIDFKQGIEFKPYATYHLPNARVIAIESEREFGLSVIDGLQAELERRARVFREKAQVENITSYRSRTQERMPRILLIVDEFQMFFAEDDHISSRASAILDQLVRQGRAYGIHVLLASQTLRSGSHRSSLSGSTIGQIGVRIALQCTVDDARVVLADDNVAPSRFTRPGEAVYNDENGLVQGNRLFQVALQTEDDKIACLLRLAQSALDQGRDPRRDQIVFEGSAPADVSLNRPLMELLSNRSNGSSPSRPRAYLGEPIAIRPPTSAEFQRTPGSNLLIVGQDCDLACGIMTTALFSLQSHSFRAAGGATFYVMDFTPIDSDAARLVVLEPDGVRVNLVGRRQLEPALTELASEVERRIELEGEAVPPIYLVIHGLQRARDLRPREDYRGQYDRDADATIDLSKLLSTIIREGPDCRVHTLIWCDTFANVERTLPRHVLNVLQECAMRVVMQVNVDDSRLLVGDESASKLGPNRAIYTHEDEGRSEKFRPYGLPASDWLQAARDVLTQPARSESVPLSHSKEDLGE